MTIKHAEIQDSGYLLFGSVTGSYQTIVTLTDDVDVLFVMSSLDQPIQLRFPKENGTTSVMVLPPNSSLAFDLFTNSKRVCKGVIAVKALSALPTSGLVSITGVR